MRPLHDDCTRCASAGSIEHGICQVCLAEQPRIEPAIAGPVWDSAFIRVLLSEPESSEAGVLSAVN